METPRGRLEINSIGSGIYHHYGIEKGFSRYNHRILGSLKEVILDIGIDRFKLRKSSSKTGWPILGSLDNCPVNPFIIGLFIGPGKPDSIDEFLRAFCIEVKCLAE